MDDELAPSARTYRGEPAEHRRSRRRTQLVEAGLQLLGTAGWQATTVTAVCEEARLTPRYFYESFSSRDDLLVAVFDTIIDEVTDRTLAAQPSTTEQLLRATVTAFVDVVAEDRRKGRVAFVEALGSTALMRRRFERMRWFADQLAKQVRGQRRLRAADARRIHTASLIASGGLVEAMMVWQEGGLRSTATQLIDDYTAQCTLLLASVLGAPPALGRTRPCSRDVPGGALTVRPAAPCPDPPPGVP